VAVARLEITNAIGGSRKRFAPAVDQVPCGKQEGDAIARVTETTTNNGLKQLALRFIVGPYRGGVYPLPTSGVIRIGRTSGLEVVLVEPTMSRMHAQVLISNGIVTISDHGSTHGTYVNGIPVVRATRLDTGDGILVGASIMKLVTADGSGLSLEEARNKVEAATVTPERNMSGIIEEIPIRALLKLLSTRRKSGVLIVNNGVSLGQIYLRRGAVYFARINDDLGESPQVSPQESFYRMLTWTTGTFELEPDPIVEPQMWEEVQESTEALLMEGVRQLDEFRNLQKQLPPLGSPLAVPAPLAGELHELTPSERYTFHLVLARGQLQKVLDNSPGSYLDAVQNILSLMRREFVVIP
jgi:pSer/pThr/pTyr-binding forkhead associated (FHA) protein